MTDNLDAYDYFFKTDHHWTSEAGFYAFTKIAEYAENVLETRVDPKVRNLDNYNVENFEEWYLGSNGQRTGIHYGGIDDFHFISPKFETAIANLNTGETGNYRVCKSGFGGLSFIS